MSKLGFLLELSIRELKRSVKINVLVILSLALGMYLPILSIADINVFFQNRKNLYPKISQDAWYCSVQSEHLTEAAYAHLAESLHLDRVGGCEKRSDTIRIADKQVSDALCVISEDFFDFARCDLLEGENIWESGGAALTKSCMLEESFPAKYGVRAEVGDSLEVNGVAYLLDILCMPLLVRTVPPDFLLIFDFSVYALGFLVLEVMCLVIGRSVGRKMAKLDIVSVLRGD
ncbi:MAG: hypothetical protein HFH93_05860 [Lachnospiraceae bacterium]|nr:hypothetical protein [Lachnospiraceae bacterium]